LWGGWVWWGFTCSFTAVRISCKFVSSTIPPITISSCTREKENGVGLGERGRMGVEVEGERKNEGGFRGREGECR